jgi:broad-specificity NMP kinase
MFWDSLMVAHVVTILKPATLCLKGHVPRYVDISMMLLLRKQPKNYKQRRKLGYRTDKNAKCEV